MPKHSRVILRQAQDEVVHDVEHPEAPAIVGFVFDEVIGPHMVRPLGPQPHARTVSEPQPPPLGLPLGYLEPLPPPDALHLAAGHDPACPLQEGGDAPVAIVPVLTRQLHDVSREPRLVVSGAGRLALGGAMLA